MTSRKVEDYLFGGERTRLNEKDIKMLNNGRLKKVTRPMLVFNKNSKKKHEYLCNIVTTNKNVQHVEKIESTVTEPTQGDKSSLNLSKKR